MAKTTTYKGFSLGDRVIIAKIAHPEWENNRPFIGKHGYVKSITKKDNMIYIMTDGGTLYGSFAENVIHE